MKRPAGIAFVALLQWLIGLGCVAVAALVVLAVFLGDAKGDPAPAAEALPYAAVAFTAATLFLSAGIGLWKLKQWGRILATFLAGVSVLIFLLSFFEQASGRHPHELRSSPYDLPVMVLLLPYHLLAWPIRQAVGYPPTEFVADVEFVTRYSMGILGNASIGRYLVGARAKQAFEALS